MKHPRRKHTIKHQPIVKKKVHNVSHLAGQMHLHFCGDRDCRQVYLCWCRTPEVNGRCDICTRGAAGAYMDMKAPRPCCFDNCELLTDTDWHDWLRLAGPGPWFQCKTCRRAHGSPLT